MRIARDREEKIVGVVGLIAFLILAMVGLYIIQIAITAPQIRIIGWLLLIGFLLVAAEANRLLSRTFCHYPDELKRLVACMIGSGVAIGILFGDLESLSAMSPLQWSITGFGVCWALSGVYLLLRRNITF